jgi:hypothetical protein
VLKKCAHNIYLTLSFIFMIFLICINLQVVHPFSFFLTSSGHHSHPVFLLSDCISDNEVGTSFIPRLCFKLYEPLLAEDLLCLEYSTVDIIHTPIAADSDGKSIFKMRDGSDIIFKQVAP